MSPEQVEVLILGSGQGGKLLAWQMAQSGDALLSSSVAGSVVPVPTLPACPARMRFGALGWLTWRSTLGSSALSRVRSRPIWPRMAAVRQRKRDMVNREIELHLQNFRASGAELIMGSGRFVAPKTLEVHLDDGSSRQLIGERVFLNIGTHAAIPEIPGRKRRGR